MELIRTSILIALVALSHSVRAGQGPKTENVIVITLDGFRWQEFFGGADEAFIEKDLGGVKDIPGTKARYLKPDKKAKRMALLPFFWGTIAKHGQIYGDPAERSVARSTNGLKFSYPGYSEMFCGVADPRIDSNDKRPNPNLSVLEHLNNIPKFRGKVVAFCTWGVFPSIFRTQQSGVFVHCSWTPIRDGDLTERQRVMNLILPTLPRIWPDNSFDIVAMEFAREHLIRHKPKVMFIGLGETDEWGHGRRYDLYLDSARYSDRFIGELWSLLQSMPEYRDKTTLLITTDHGRGPTRSDWTDHGQKVPGAEIIWMAAMGPDTPPLGVRRDVQVTQSQLAASVAHVLGEDFTRAVPKAAKPLPDLTR